MTIDEIKASEDVSALYELQRAAKASGDEATERAAARRLRDLAGGNTDAQPYRPAIHEMPPVIVSPSDAGGAA